MFHENQHSDGHTFLKGVIKLVAVISVCLDRLGVTFIVEDLHIVSS